MSAGEDLAALIDAVPHYSPDGRPLLAETIAAIVDEPKTCPKCDGEGAFNCGAGIWEPCERCGGFGTVAR